MVHEPCFLDSAEQTHKWKLFCLSGTWGPTGTPPHTQVLLMCLWGEGERGGSKLVTWYFTQGNKSIRLEVCNKILGKIWTFLVAQWSRICLPTQGTQEIWVWSLGLEDPLEEEVATRFSILAWKIPWTKRNLARCSPWGCRRSDRT